MCFINQQFDSSLLLLASNDGVVRVWSGIDSPDTCRLTTSWRVIAGMEGLPNSSGLLIDWQEQYGTLFTGGDMGIIRLWDLEKESLINNIQTEGETCVTSLASGKNGSKMLICGFADGSIKMFDTRMNPKFANVQSYKEHKDWVVKVSIPTSNPNKFISGCTAGFVKIWDLEKPNSLNTIAAHNGLMTTLAVHDYAPILATGSEKQKIKVHDLDGNEISMIRYHDGFLGQRIGPVSSLAFHPNLLLLAGGSSDALVSIYTKRTTNQ